MEENKFILQEEQLQLVVGKKTLGSLTTNAKQIKELVEKALPNYDISNYSEDNIDSAKKDKAMLNKASKTLNAKRIEFEKEFMKPFAEFKEVVGETVKLISECSSKIDTVVKESVEKYKKEKKALIQSHFDGHEFELVGLDRIFDEKWLNKTSKIKDIQKEVDEKITKIKDDLITLEAINENVDLLKALYLDTLNINTTIQYSNTLKENAKKASEAAEKAVAASAPEPVDQPEENPFESASDTSYGAGSAVQTAGEDDALSKISSEPELLVRSLRVTATKEKIIALADFMNVNGIQFEKLDQ